MNLQGYAQLDRSGSYRPVGAASLAPLARMAQQADAADSKSAARKGVRVRIPLRALTELEPHRAFQAQTYPAGGAIRA